MMPTERMPHLICRLMLVRRRSYGERHSEASWRRRMCANSARGILRPAPRENEQNERERVLLVTLDPPLAKISIPSHSLTHAIKITSDIRHKKDKSTTVCLCTAQTPSHVPKSGLDLIFSLHTSNREQHLVRGNNGYRFGSVDDAYMEIRRGRRRAGEAPTTARIGATTEAWR